jgi:hypothetical protein
MIAIAITALVVFGAVVLGSLAFASRVTTRAGEPGPRQRAIAEKRRILLESFKYYRDYHYRAEMGDINKRLLDLADEEAEAVIADREGR